MVRQNSFALLLMTLALWFGCTPAALASESHDTCAHYITSLSASVDAPGTWCLARNLSSAITDGAAIYITASDVTLDCNDFQLDNLAAGAGTYANGIDIAGSLQHTTVRHCVVTGFRHGLFDHSGSDLMIEDNHFDRNTTAGIWASSYNTVVRRNLVSNTNTGTLVAGDPATRGICVFGSGDIRDNTVAGVVDPTGGSSYIYGILADLDGGSVEGNRVRGVRTNGSQLVMAIGSLNAVRFTLRDNQVIGDGSAGVIGLHCADAHGRSKNNVINGFAIATENCGDAGGNDITN